MTSPIVKKENDLCAISLIDEAISSESNGRTYRKGYFSSFSSRICSCIGNESSQTQSTNIGLMRSFSCPGKVENNKPLNTSNFTCVYTNVDQGPAIVREHIHSAAISKVEREEIKLKNPKKIISVPRQEHFDFTRNTSSKIGNEVLKNEGLMKKPYEMYQSLISYLCNENWETGHQMMQRIIPLYNQGCKARWVEYLKMKHSLIPTGLSTHVKLNWVDKERTRINFNVETLFKLSDFCDMENTLGHCLVKCDVYFEIIDIVKILKDSVLINTKIDDIIPSLTVIDSYYYDHDLKKY